MHGRSSVGHILWILIVTLCGPVTGLHDVVGGYYHMLLHYTHAVCSLVEMHVQMRLVCLLNNTPLQFHMVLEGARASTGFCYVWM